MAQHDYNIEDQNGFDFLVDLNNVLSAIATNNAGSPEPNPTFPHMLWFDTNNLLMKVRNASNSAWDIVAAKDANGWTPYRQGTALGTASVQPDTRYVHRSNNLSDLPNLETARATLGLVIGTDIPPKASPQFTGVPRAPTAATATNTNQIATTAYVRAMAHPLAAGAGVGMFTGISATSGAPLVLPAGGTWIYFYLLVSPGGGISGHLSSFAAGGSTIYGGSSDIQPIGWAWRKA